jgi:hypothetical protein
MIFATDHDAGNRIMGYLYAAAARDLPRMAEEAHHERRGVMTLFGTAGADASYVHEAAMEPSEMLTGLIAAR